MPSKSPSETQVLESVQRTDDEAIRVLVARLARPHRSGGDVIERAAILAAGGGSEAVLAWIAAHDGQPEMQSAARVTGLHGARLSDSAGAASSTPRRYVLPPGALA
jgi:hypothetical protein